MESDEAGQEPELEPALDEAVAYKVIGPNEVCGHKPGSRFTGSLAPDHERHLIESGNVARLATRKPPSNAKEKNG